MRGLATYLGVLALSLLAGTAVAQDFTEVVHQEGNFKIMVDPAFNSSG